jgi:boron transporter
MAIKRITPFSGVCRDIIGRIPHYKDDWLGPLQTKQKLRILASATYIFFASAIPALAFGQQFFTKTNGTINVVQVLTSTAIAGVTQSLVGGQPLLIIGVAEPIVLVYGYMYDFAKDSEDLQYGALFLPWAAWCCVWTAVFIFILSAVNSCTYINKFTRFAGELFGMLIAILFMQQAIKGLIDEFKVPNDDNVSTDPEASEYSWRMVNGIWSLFLAFGLILTCLFTRNARKWRFLRGPLRSVLADYGVPVMVVLWSGISFAVTDTPNGIPSRVNTPNTWDVTSNWTVATQMNQIPGSLIAGAMIPALIMCILFYFDHNVSSQMAQQEEFNLKKPTSFHWDFMLLGVMELICGLIGIPPVNGVLPQAPMHTKSLSKVVKHKEEDKGRRMTATNGTTNGYNNNNNNNINRVVELEVSEQRISNLLQALAVGVCLAITPAIKQIPAAVLWGYFAFMAIESLPGSQFWDRFLLLLTDPKKRYLIYQHGHAPYIETVPFKSIVWFTLLQMALLGAVYGLTWAGIAGILFPIPIMLLVPFRQWAMPKMFKPLYLEELDKMDTEEAPPLEPGAAMEGEMEGDETELLDDEIVHYHVKHHLTRDDLVHRRSSLAEPDDDKRNNNGRNGDMEEGEGKKP